MRDHLHRRTQVVATPFFGNHVAVNAPRGAIVELAHSSTNKSLVVAQIKIRFRTIARDVDLPMLERAHRARINVQVGIELDQGDFQTSGFEYCCERRA